jgi:hypothetical protein
MSNIVNSRQIPLATQRSDDWILEETPVKFPTPQGMPEKEARGYARSRIVKELELDDTERRIKEAEATIAELKEPFAKAKSDWEKKKAEEAKKVEAKNAPVQ